MRFDKSGLILDGSLENQGGGKNRLMFGNNSVYVNLPNFMLS